MQKEIIKIDNLKCGGCVNTVTKHLNAMEGVDNIEVDLPSSTITLERDKAISRNSIIKSLGGLGYPEAGTSGFIQKAKSYVSCLVGRMDD